MPGRIRVFETPNGKCRIIFRDGDQGRAPASDLERGNRGLVQSKRESQSADVGRP